MSSPTTNPPPNEPQQEPDGSALHSSYDTSTGIIAWFARNSVAANLLMACIIIAGVMAALQIRKQMFPAMEINWINVNIPYRGAAPQEVEEAITVKLEEALAQVQGLERVITYSNRGNASANIQVLESYDIREVLDDVKSSIDSISSFPAGMERPIVNQAKYRQEVMYISLSGDLDRKYLKQLGQSIQDELQNLPGVNITDYYSGAGYEIAIEVDPIRLREYDLTFNDISQAISKFSTNSSAGQIRADEGTISVRVENQAYVGYEYENIPIKTLPNGTQLLVGDIATVRDGFEEGISFNKLDGQNAVIFFVGASADQSITVISETVNDYLQKRQATLPEGVRLEPWVDLTYYLNGRLNMMLSNMWFGGILVLLILATFLRLRLAFWVMMGLPVSFLGALALLPISYIDVTINVVSLFAFIMVLGVVVDDAIVIGESVASEVEEKGQTLDNVIRGAQRVAVPATFGVLTTIAAFWPMVMESGPQSEFSNAIGTVVVLCLLFSLVESKLILPSHLAHMKPENPETRGFLKGPRNAHMRFRQAVDRKLNNFIQNIYQPFIYKAIHYRYVVWAAFTALIFITASFFIAGKIGFVGFPKVPHDFLDINIEMAENTPEQVTLNTIESLNDIVEKANAMVEEEYGATMVDRIMLEIHSRTSAKITAKLVDPEIRPASPLVLSAKVREIMPKFPGLKRITIRDTIGGGGGGGANNGDISFRIKSKDEAQLKAVAAAIKDELATYEGVFEINDSEQDPVTEARFSLKPHATSLGLTIADVAGQASAALYGLEAQRIVRDRDEIRVMVRYPEHYRDAISHVGNVLIQTPAGTRVPLNEIANIDFVDSVNQIYREDGNRAITVYASVDAEKTSTFKVADALKADLFEKLKGQYSRVEIEEAGDLKDNRETMQNNIINIFKILIPIYILLALPLRSYLQPLMIMSVIPFGVVGAIYGHLLLGLDLSAMSLFGIFAVVGVVVNDSLVMVDYVNSAKKAGYDLVTSVCMAGVKRFRAIILTSLTTFFGLIPIIFEPSLQAQIVIPMAVSLAFGVLFATVVTLILIPCLYVMARDVKQVIVIVFNAFAEVFWILHNFIFAVQTPPKNKP